MMSRYESVGSTGFCPKLFCRPNYAALVRYFASLRYLQFPLWIFSAFRSALRFASRHRHLFSFLSSTALWCRNDINQVILSHFHPVLLILQKCLFEILYADGTKTHQTFWPSILWLVVPLTCRCSPWTMFQGLDQSSGKHRPNCIIRNVYFFAFCQFFPWCRRNQLMLVLLL